MEEVNEILAPGAKKQHLFHSQTERAFWEKAFLAHFGAYLDIDTAAIYADGAVKELRDRSKNLR